MVSFRTAFVALAGAAVALAQSGCSGINCFTNSNFTGLQAGGSFTFTWDHLTGNTVTLQLRSGNSAYLGAGYAIASNITNTGSFTWSIPQDVVNGDAYAVEILDDQDNSKINYSAQFSISSTVLTTSTSSGMVSSTSMSGSSSTGSMTTSASASASSSGSMTTSASSTTSSASQSAGVQQTTSTKSGSAHRATAVAGMLGMVALGALAL